MFTIESHLFLAPIASLHPTQITVGFDEVEDKRRKWARLKGTERLAKMREELFPVVCGQDSQLYVLDHHHAALALTLEGCEEVHAGLVRDLSHLSHEAFWVYLDHFSWVHAYDAKGRPRPFDDIPRRFLDMKDDPYRSFAARVRDAGGFAKPAEPFQEFLWANFLRSEIPSAELKHDSKRAFKKALALVKTNAAEHLPGWSGTK